MLFKQLRDMISSLSCHADTILDHIEKLEIVGDCGRQWPREREGAALKS
jgi:hypothetical protein